MQSVCGRSTRTPFAPVTTMRALLLLALIASCHTRHPTTPRAVAPAPASAPIAPSVSAVTATDAERALCLPIVSGCGCAYACAWSVRRIDVTTYEVAHDFQDSRLDRVVVERACFDAAGTRTSHTAESGSPSGCIDVFYDRTPCGGECIPRPEYLHCGFVGERCTTTTGTTAH